MDIQIINNFVLPLLSLIIATLVGSEIVRIVYSPKVKVKVKESNYLKNKNGFLTALEIVNLGSSVATKCISYLVIHDNNKIEKDDLLSEFEACENEYLPSYTDENLDYTIPRQQWITPEKYVTPKRLVLCWNHSGDPYEMDINPGVTVSLNICRMRYHDIQEFWYIIFPTEKGWRKVRLRMRFKELKGKIFICPSNAFPLIVGFNIQYDSQIKEPVLIIDNKAVSRRKRKRILLRY
ncbi:MAG: hypothetical protein WDO19_30445 [Bacteroidota bacterium]